MYICKQHGKQSTEWCQECQKILICDCATIDYQFIDIVVPFDNHKKERICQDCGKIHKIKMEK